VIEEIGLASDLAAGLGVPFTTLSVQVAAGASRQAQARHARYEALFQCARSQKADRIAVGHTLDDQAETVLARLLRGTGIDGLAAIHPARADGVIRPLIDAPRSAVHAYAQDHAIPFARDPSNLDPRYLRVRIRQELLPRLCVENPRLPEQLAALADDAREVAHLLEPEVLRARELLEKEGAVPFLAVSAHVRRAALKSWAELRTQTPIQRTHLFALERMLFRGGQVRLPGAWVACLDSRSHLVLTPSPKRGRGVPRRTKGER
jgi:tRNA(Ile)-lysidine synthase